MITNEKCNLPFGLLGSGIKMTLLTPALLATKLKLATPLQSNDLGPTHSSHATITAWSQLQAVGEHTLVNQIRLCV